MTRVGRTPQKPHPRVQFEQAGAGIGLLTLLALAACTPEATPGPEVPAIAYCDGVREWDAQHGALEEEVLVLVNERRAEGAICGSDEEFPPAPELQMDPALRCAARVHALDMGAQDYFNNLDPEGVDYSERAQRAGYAGNAVGQIIGSTHREADQLVTALMGSTGLCRTLMDPEARAFGMGYAPASEAEYPYYWTQVYGDRE